jgi:hypothetical protein
MSDEPKGYQTYLLRLWFVQVQGKKQWRASIESPHTGERQVFARLEQLFAFIGERCEAEEPGELEVERKDFDEDRHGNGENRRHGEW